MTSHNPAVSGGHHSSDDIPMTHPTENGNSANSIDDIWGSDETYHHNHNHHHYYHHHHHHDQATQHHHNHQQQPHQIALDLVVSDIPRLSQSHQTAGYRDGIAAAKARTAQHGFDEGYPLGAHIGARAGQLLGVLEGLAAAVGLHALSSSSLQLLPTPPLEPSSSSSSARPRSSSYDEARRLEGVLAEARRELSVGGVFDGQYWASDGTWRYQVGNDGYGGYGQAKKGGNGRAGEEAVEFDGENVVFPDVAEAHPLLRKWSRIVRAEAARYGVDWEVLKDEVPGDVRAGGEEMEEERDREREGRMKRERGGQQPAVRGREALAW